MLWRGLAELVWRRALRKLVSRSWQTTGSSPEQLGHGLLRKARSQSPPGRRADSANGALFLDHAAVRLVEELNDSRFAQTHDWFDFCRASGLCLARSMDRGNHLSAAIFHGKEICWPGVDT